MRGRLCSVYTLRVNSAWNLDVRFLMFPLRTKHPRQPLRPWNDCKSSVEIGTDLRKKNRKMRSTTLTNKCAKGMAIFGSLIALPVVVVRTVMNLPATFVDAIERLAYEK